jgi:hypothetical protein
VAKTQFSKRAVRREWYVTQRRAGQSQTIARAKAGVSRTTAARWDKAEGFSSSLGPKPKTRRKEPVDPRLRSDLSAISHDGRSIDISRTLPGAGRTLGASSRTIPRSVPGMQRPPGPGSDENSSTEVSDLVAGVQTREGLDPSDRDRYVALPGTIVDALSDEQVEVRPPPRPNSLSEEELRRELGRFRLPTHHSPQGEALARDPVAVYADSDQPWIKRGSEQETGPLERLRSIRPTYEHGRSITLHDAGVSAEGLPAPAVASIVVGSEPRGLYKARQRRIASRQRFYVGTWS